tara:strand:- start:832 stop:1662 length:831 start_codon:yes stop_codon:yes gene_type:complete
MHSNTPNFIIAGVMKGGTTAAAFNLNKHQNIFCLTQYWKNRVLNDEDYNYAAQTGSWAGNMKVANKEMDYFNLDTNYNLSGSFDIYKSFFPRKLDAIGEASPNYFCLDENNNGQSATRIASDLPDAKVIILLRDPINRAYSHWNHIDSKRPSWGSDYHDIPFIDVVKVDGNNLVSRSKYLANLTAWTTAIGSDKVYVALQESIATNPLEEYNKICTFLGVDHFHDSQTFQKIFALNYNSLIQPSTIEYLKPVFASDVTGIKDLYPHLDYSLWNDYS